MNENNILRGIPHTFLFSFRFIYLFVFFVLLLFLTFVVIIPTIHCNPQLLAYSMRHFNVIFNKGYL